MKRYLHVVSIITIVFSLFSKVQAQSDQTVAIGVVTTAVNFTDGVGVDNGSKVVDVINASTNAIIATVPVRQYPRALDNFVTGNAIGLPITLAITVNPSPASPPAITASNAIGSISACVGTSSSSPDIQQFSVSGNNLTANITATAPTGFEVSLSAMGGYGNSLTLAQTGGSVGSSPSSPQSGNAVNSPVVYVRSTASAPTGGITGNVVLSSAGAISQNVMVKGIVNALPTINAISDQTANSGAATTAINFTGTGNVFNWVNDTPAIGLSASGAGNIASFDAINTGTTPVKATITATPIAGGLAYIENVTDGTISIINTETNVVTGTISIGKGYIAICVSPDGSRVYVANANSNTISVINTSTNAVIASIPVGLSHSGICVSPDGKRLYVSNTSSNTVFVINTATNTLVATVTVGNYPVGVTASPDGSRVYVANSNGNSISVINTTTNLVIATITVGAYPVGLSISPDGSRVYVSNNIDNTVSVISTTGSNVISTIPVGASPYGITVSADGNSVYVTNYGSNNVSVINTAANTLVTNIPVGVAPYGISISSDGGKIYVVNQGSGSVSVINATDYTILSTINVGSGPASFGNFVTAGTACSGLPIKFTITVNPVSASPPAITAGNAIGNISACVGTPSASPNIQQFSVLTSNLTGNVIATAPTGFEVSLSATSGYGSSVMLTQTFDPLGGSPLPLQSGNLANSAVVYVRSAASAPAGGITGNVVLSSAGVVSGNVAVKGTVNALPTVNYVTDQTVLNGVGTTAVNFTGTANTISWTNDTPAIGLAASGTGDITSFTAVNTTSAALKATITATPMSAGSAYILNGGSNNISVINTTTNKVVSTIPGISNPFGAMLSPDGSRLYITSNGSNSISVINTLTNALVGTIPAGKNPLGIAVSPDGSLLYVTYGEDDTIISVISTASNTVIATVQSVLYNYGIAISPDGNSIYVVNDNSNTVSVINAATYAVTATIPVGASPYGVCLSPDGKFVYVSNNDDNSVSVINALSNSVIATIGVGSDPNALAISPDGSRLYVTNLNSSNVSVINTATNALVTTIPVGTFPFGISLSPDGSELFVANNGSNSVSVISTATNKVIAVTEVGTNPESFGSFVKSTMGCSGPPVTFTITVEPGASPPLITATGSLAGLNTIYGTESTSTVFFVSGTNLTGGILVSPPPGFEVSTNDITFSNTVIINSTAAASPVQIYIRLAATTPVGNYSGNIASSSNGATTVNVAMPNSTVTPALLTVTADNKSKVLGTVNPALTTTYVGFVNNDGLAKITILPEISTTAVTTSPVGEYPITASGASSPNYTFTYIPGVLTVTPLVEPIVIPNAFTPNGDGVNDIWNIKNLQSYPNCIVNVYNRYGENVYSSIGYGVPWDGEYKGSLLPTGTYYYLINLKNDIKVLSGFVAIIR